MDYEKFGIVITLIIVFITCGFIGISQFELFDTPYITSITSETSVSQNTVLSDYCAKLNINC